MDSTLNSMLIQLESVQHSASQLFLLKPA